MARASGEFIVGECFSEAVQYTVVVPVYNTDRSLRELYERLKEVFDSVLSSTFEVIFVDDASPNPETWRTVVSLHEQDSRVRAYQLMRNGGQQNATMCGLKEARGERCVIMDDDLQHLPEEIPKLIRALDRNDGLDVIIGVAEKREHAHYRNVGSLIFGKVMDIIIHKPGGIRFSSFILMDRHVRDSVIKFSGTKITVCSLICMNTGNIGNVTVKSAPRKYGKSGYTIYKLAALAMNHMFNFSSFPLQLMSIVGAGASVLSVCYACYVLYLRVTQQIGVAGFTTIVILLSLYSGVLMFSLGIVGHYMIRILRATTYGQQFGVRRSLSSGMISSPVKSLPASADRVQGKNAP